MIEINNLSYKYRDEDESLTLNNINLKINDGEFISIIGHNGSGKSTFSKHLNGLIIPKENMGEIYVDGTLIKDDLNLHNIRKKIGVVFQNPDNQFVGGTIEEDMAFGLENYEVPHEDMRGIIEEASKKVGVDHLLNRPPHKLSGGQKQRCAIGSILALNPKYIVLDEPTSMLDPKGRKEIIEILKELNKEGVTIILITHFMDEVVGSDRIVLMDKGEIIKVGSPKEMYKDLKFLEKYKMELPKATELGESLKREGINIGENILTLEELGEVLWKLK